MALNLENKKVIVTEINEVANNSAAMIAAEYRGLTVAEMTELRVKARADGLYVRVVRNTLARRALETTDFAGVTDLLVGPLVLAFAKNDPGAPARLMKDFSKGHEKLKVKAGVVGTTVFGIESLDKIASLPTKEQALGQLLSVLNAPITKLVRTLVEPHSKLVRVLAAIRDQKQAS